ncbi:HIT domain [Nesidiocoris tenuis]|uniref:HIT domain n=1 Tax=Nesidiocoris tenuis TaxID=355587 RepID=A0ABN7A7Y2_9HEMI|nr:HIT domain [Nesidiocoris tenuis]
MWKFELIKLMKDPAYLIFTDELIAIIRDGYPKAEFHYLVLPHQDISNLAATKKDDAKLLRHMESKGREIAEKYGGQRNFKYGYHTEPSMERLHLHVISDDMNSPSLKHKKHWNSFTTPFFMESEKAIKDLETHGRVIFPSKEEIKTWLNLPLKCHKCDYKPKFMPDLKRHILTHL